MDSLSQIISGVSYLSREQEGEALKKANLVFRDESFVSSKDDKDMPVDNIVDVLFTERMKNRLGEWRGELLSGRKGESQSYRAGKESEQQLRTVFFKMHPAVSLNGFSAHQLRLIQLVKLFSLPTFSKMIFERYSLLNLLALWMNKNWKLCRL